VAYGAISLAPRHCRDGRDASGMSAWTPCRPETAWRASRRISLRWGAAILAAQGRLEAGAPSNATRPYGGLRSVTTPLWAGSFVRAPGAAASPPPCPPASGAALRVSSEGRGGCGAGGCLQSPRWSPWGSLARRDEDRS
jgi:hypothetical protein